jgi:hypothetical protein
MRGTVLSLRRVAYLVLLLSVGALGACNRSSRPRAATPQDGRITPVLVELFTSEGCSSCPPADRVLSQLVSTQPIPGVEIIALGEHVDYWDKNSWRDRFSSASFTARQSEYRARVFPTNVVYTPQLVIDGALECIGSDLPAVRNAIEEAARGAKAQVRASVEASTGSTRRVTVDVVMPPSVVRDGPADVVVVTLQDGLETVVRGGENGGRTLRHDAVVRSMQVIGEVGADVPEATIAGDVQLDDDWDQTQLRFAAFVQERTGRRVLGSAAGSMPAEP